MIDNVYVERMEQAMKHKKFGVVEWKVKICRICEKANLKMV